MKWLEAYRDENKMIDKITDDFTNGKYTVYVAENDGKLIGFIGGSIKENADKTYSKMGYIEDWFVTEKWRGQGIGQSLYDKLAEDFKDCDYLSLYAYLSNPAIEMYKKMGFAPCSLMMVKKIGVSNPSKKEEK
jgi:ribosomal protein S18 acetylase RimI-like enzyme